MGAMSLNLFDKVFEKFALGEMRGTGEIQLGIFRRLLHEVTSPEAFVELRKRNIGVFDPHSVFATCDHVNPTLDPCRPYADPNANNLISILEMNCKKYGIRFFSPNSGEGGVCHIIFPEKGIIWPGGTYVCGDSHTSTYGALGAIAFGIGTSDLGYALGTKTVTFKEKPKVRQIIISSVLQKSVTAKDVIIYTIWKMGAGAGAGYAHEYCGSVIDEMPQYQRFTLCNMGVESGSKAAYVNPDNVTYDYLKTAKPYAPSAAMIDSYYAPLWNSFRSDPNAYYDDKVSFSGEDIPIMVTWGNIVAQAIPISDVIPQPNSDEDKRALEYMSLTPGEKLEAMPIDMAFIGSCTNGRLEDLIDAAEILKGNKVRVKTLIVPGSDRIKKRAEELGLDKIFKAAGAEWRFSGCSMCLKMNNDQVNERIRIISTSNRPFENRQGTGSMTHLASPKTVAASSIYGQICNPELLNSETIIVPDTSEIVVKPVEDITTSLRDDNGNKEILTLSGTAIPKPGNSQNTDAILPANFLSEPNFDNMANYVYYDERYDKSGKLNPNHPFNGDTYSGGRFLLTGNNYGEGSSREHAPQGLKRFGIDVIVASSFADIFLTNAEKVGLICINLSKNDLDVLIRMIQNAPKSLIVMGFEDQTLICNSNTFHFEIIPSTKEYFLSGVHALDNYERLLLTQDKTSDFFENLNM